MGLEYRKTTGTACSRLADVSEGKAAEFARARNASGPLLQQENEVSVPELPLFAAIEYAARQADHPILKAS
jgi:hypothetical protein